MSLRVLLVGPYPLAQDKVVGGVEAVTSTLALALTANDEIEKLTIVCFHHGEVASHRRKVNDKLQVWYVKGQNHLALPTRSFLSLLQARRIAAEIEPDVVHGQGIGALGDVATGTGPAAVITAHGLVHIEARLASRGGLQDRIRVNLTEAMVRRVLSRAQVVISTSAYDSRALNGWVRGKCASIANPVLPEFFAEPESQQAQARVLFAGMLVRRKNVEGLLSAFARVRARVPEARLVILGPSPDPSYAVQVRRHARDLALESAVDWLGHIEHAELVREIRQCSVLALFSREETSPTIIAQAMAAGKPIVASKVGGVPEMVLEGENGFLVESEDEGALAERLATLLKSPEMCRRMGSRSREIAQQRFEPSVVAKRTLDAYRLAIE